MILVVLHFDSVAALPVQVELLQSHEEDKLPWQLLY